VAEQSGRMSPTVRHRGGLVDRRELRRHARVCDRSESARSRCRHLGRSSSGGASGSHLTSVADGGEPFVLAGGSCMPGNRPSTSRAENATAMEDQQARKEDSARSSARARRYASLPSGPSWSGRRVRARRHRARASAPIPIRPYGLLAIPPRPAPAGRARRRRRRLARAREPSPRGVRARRAPPRRRPGPRRQGWPSHRGRR